MDESMGRAFTTTKKRPVAERSPELRESDGGNGPDRLIHPAAICESDSVGTGTRIWAWAHVMKGAVLGDHCNVADHVFIESGARVGNRVTLKNGVMIWNGVTIDDDVFIGPGVLFTNDRHPRSPRMKEVAGRYDRTDLWLERTHVERGASLGAGAIVLCGLTIGPHAMIGAGALVTRDVDAHALLTGRPARAVGWVCVCGAPLPPTLTCRGCDRKFATTPGGLVVT